MRGWRRLEAAAATLHEVMVTGLWLGLAVLGWGFGLIMTAPERLGRGVAGLWEELATTARWRGALLGLAVLLALATLPGWAGRPVVVAITGALWLAYAGQAWNILTGFAGPLSLGPVLYIGLGAGLGIGLGPWLGPLAATVVAMVAAAVAAAITGALALRCGRNQGVVFALLTLIFAETGHLAFSQLGGWSGLGAPVTRGGPVAIYYLMLAMTVGLLVLSRQLLRARLGRRWLAVREDPVAAAAVGVPVAWARLSAMAVSAALTAPAGLILAWSSPPPSSDSLFSLTRTLEIALVAMVGGLGTLIGPVLGAALVAPTAAALDWLAQRPGHHPLPGLTGLGIGLALVAVVALLPRGLWPSLGHRLGLVVKPSDRGGRRR
jgi:branched-chain amino acid transport system permease protein